MIEPITFLASTTPVPTGDGSRRIGPGEPCFVIAEAGVNHNGDVQLAKQLVDAARDAGADAVKFQTWVTEELIAPDAQLADYQRENIGQDISQFEAIKELELGYDDFRELKAYADAAGVLFMSTPDEERSADFLDELGLPLFKIGSGEVATHPYLGYVGAKGKPIILSTGMATLSEVEAAVRVIEATGNHDLVLLHCVSDYPADPGDSNLRAMKTMELAFGHPVGFSDHTMGFDVSVAAVALGACVIEKHLTLDTGLPGPDHKASLDPQEFGAMVRAIRSVERALGDGIKRPTPAEEATKLVVRKSLVAARDLAAGEEITEDKLALFRTSGGVGWADRSIIIGRRVKAAVPRLGTITPDMLQ